MAVTKDFLSFRIPSSTRLYTYIFLPPLGANIQNVDKYTQPIFRWSLERCPYHHGRLLVAGMTPQGPKMSLGT